MKHCIASLMQVLLERLTKLLRTIQEQCVCITAFNHNLSDMLHEQQHQDKTT